MRQDCYLNLLILSITFFSSILPSPANDSIESPNLHIRQKRIINDDNDIPVHIEQVPYIVNIFCNGKRCCGGAILSPNIIITAAHCVFYNEAYSILSGSSLRNSGSFHRVVNVKVNENFNTHSKSHYDLALLKIHPAINIVHSPNRVIEIHSGYLVPHMKGILSGWGCHQISTPNWEHPNELRSISISIISQRECQNHYRGYAVITDKFICTHDERRHRGSCNGDSGGPLVVEGKLMGILSWCKGYVENPDVFVKVSDLEHRAWIRTTMRDLGH